MTDDIEFRKQNLILEGLAPADTYDTVIEVDDPGDLPLNGSRRSDHVSVLEPGVPFVFYYRDDLNRLVAQRNTALSINAFIERYWVDRRTLRFVTAQRHRW